MSESGGVHASARNPFTDRMEAVLGVDPRDTLAHLRAAQQKTAKLRRKESELAAQAAMYEARFGYPSHFEHERKAILSRLMEEIRQEMQEDGEKPTEKLLDNQAHSHPEYLALLASALTLRQEWEKIKANLTFVRNEIEISKGTEIYYERTARMNDSLTYAAGKEMGL